MDENTSIYVEFDLTDGLQNYFNVFLKYPDLPVQLKDKIQSHLSATTAPFSTMYNCYLWSKHRKNQDHIPLWRILSLTKVVLSKPKPPARNAEVDERVRELNAKFSNMTYNKMVAGLSPKLGVPLLPDKNYCSEMRCVNNQLIMILNFTIIVLSGFAFGFYIPELTGHPDAEITVKLACALAIASIVFFADLYFLTKNMSVLEKR